MVYYKNKNGLKIAEIWYGGTERPTRPCDVLRFRYVQGLPSGSCSVESLFTILLDLGEAEEKIVAALDKTTRYQANRAKERDGISTVTVLGAGERNDARLAEYIEFYNAFAATKKRDDIASSDLKQFYEAGTLCIRAALTPEGTTLAMHANVVSDRRARLHQSSSLFRQLDSPADRNLIGRANRYLHLDDILYFKALGLAYYDFGGWYGGDSDAEKLAINAFKESFGGTITPEFSGILPCSVVGRLSVAVRAVMRNVLK